MLSPGRKTVGTTVRMAVTFNNDNVTDLDPATVTLKIISPTGSITTYVYGTDDELEREDTGDYFCDFSPTEPGRWNFQFNATGDGTAIIEEDSFVVQDTPFYSGVR
ncbi:MAG: hypothetical protein AB7O43_17745, partial [Hyphomicrobiaceae bacterium]